MNRKQCQKENPNQKIFKVQVKPATSKEIQRTCLCYSIVKTFVEL